MEALAVVALTGNILQFIEVASRLVSSTSQISCVGSKGEYIEIETISNELQRLARTIRSQKPYADNAFENKDEEVLFWLSNQCIEVTDQLLAVLDSVKLRAGSGKFKNFYHALKSEWKAKEIEALHKRVERIGQVLTESLRASELRKISRKLDQLAFDNDRLRAGRSEQIEELEGLLKAAIKGLKEELRPNGSAYVPSSAIFLDLAAKGAIYSAEQKILASFRFTAIDDRYEGIKAAHHNTFSWIFDPESSFFQWLTSSDDLYWVSGKPGSGKSTLMKYLCTHEETIQRLQQWAQGNRLVVANFFFWYGGGQNTLQRSQEGLLRSLLYHILRRCPELIQKIYPEIGQLYGEECPKEHIHEVIRAAARPMSVSGLLAVLRSACDLLATSNTRLCFFIDGMDEYEGRPSDIIELIRILKAIPNIKICASSRPWNEFENSFGKDSSQKLYMHHLTENDIRNYVYDTFEGDENYQCLEEKDEQGVELINEILESAQGVFLWVFLVVHLLQEGLVNGDTMVDLQRRLHSLPSELNDLFQKILLADVSEFYRPQAARMFMAAQKAQFPLPLMAYWYMDQESLDYAFELEICPLSVQKVNLRIPQMRKRLNACCKGLLEERVTAVDDELAQMPFGILFHKRVEFFHRTVKDFFASPETEGFLSHWNPQIIDPDISICNALLSVIKSTPQDFGYFLLDGGAVEWFHLLLLHAKELNDSPSCDVNYLIRLTDHLEATLTDLDQRIGQELYHDMLSFVAEKKGWDFSERKISFPPIGVVLGLGRVVEHKVDNSSSTFNKPKKQLPSLLWLALKAQDLSMVKLLLRRDVDPNGMVKGGNTVWMSILRLLEKKSDSKKSGKLDELGLYHCVRSLLEHGADPTAEISWEYKPLRAKSVLEDALVPRQMALIEHFFLGSIPTSRNDSQISISEASRGTAEDYSRKE